jgi:hypothetical protein
MTAVDLNLRRCSAPLAVAMLIVLTAGCGGVVHPPKQVDQPTKIFLKLDARHSAIMFPRTEDHYVEYSFGAFRWFAHADTRWPIATGSLLGFMQSTLQSDEVPIVDGVPQTVAQRGFHPIIVDRRRAEALRMELDARFNRNRDTYHYNELYGMSFVVDDEPYWVFNNCNQVTAMWLRRLGCRVEGLTLTNAFRVVPP